MSFKTRCFNDRTGARSLPLLFSNNFSSSVDDYLSAAYQCGHAAGGYPLPGGHEFIGPASPARPVNDGFSVGIFAIQYAVGADKQPSGPKADVNVGNCRRLFGNDAGRLGGFFCGYHCSSYVFRYHPWYPISQSQCSGEKLVSTHERGTANAIYGMGGCIGPALAIPLYGWLIQSWGWEYSFFVPGVLGLACVVPFLLYWVSDQPDDNPYISDAENSYIKSHLCSAPASENNNDKPEGFSQVLKNKSFWMLCVAYAAFNCSWWGLLTWIPQYLVQARNFDMSGMTSYVTIAYIVAVIGVFAGGRLVDYAQNKSVVGLVALSGVALATFGISAIPSSTGAIICIVLAVGINEFVFPTVWSILQGITPGRLMATGAGVISGIANLFSAATPFIMGFLIQVTGSYASGLMFLVVMAILGALSCLALLRQGH